MRSFLDFRISAFINALCIAFILRLILSVTPCYFRRSANAWGEMAPLCYSVNADILRKIEARALLLQPARCEIHQSRFDSVRRCLFFFAPSRFVVYETDFRFVPIPGLWTAGQVRPKFNVQILPIAVVGLLGFYLTWNYTEKCTRAQTLPLKIRMLRWKLRSLCFK